MLDECKHAGLNFTEVFSDHMHGQLDIFGLAHCTCTLCLGQKIVMHYFKGPFGIQQLFFLYIIINYNYH